MKYFLMFLLVLFLLYYNAAFIKSMIIGCCLNFLNLKIPMLSRWLKYKMECSSNTLWCCVTSSLKVKFKIR